jgi:formate-dependent nitrite reductase membrane component NrfD
MNETMTGFDAAKERRLETLREEAAREGLVRAPGLRPSGGPMPSGGQLPGADAQSGYYGLPLLKEPVWTWEVPVYFFVGGAAGGASLIAAIARWVARDPALERDARRIAFLGGAVVSPVLLIADLGRPVRFLYMLRVIKPQSPMSVGVWTLVAFAGAAMKAALARLIASRASKPALRRVAGLVVLPADAASLVTGLALSTYTAVLIGVTAIPVWAHNARVLPLHFGMSGLGSAAALLELGHDHPGLDRIGLGVAATETALEGYFEARRDRAFDPLHKGRSGMLIRIGAALSGPVPLVLRLFGRRSRALRLAAAVSMLAGAAITRFAWMAAGRASAEDSRDPLQLEADSRQLPAQ